MLWLVLVLCAGGVVFLSHCFLDQSRSLDVLSAQMLDWKETVRQNTHGLQQNITQLEQGQNELASLVQKINHSDVKQVFEVDVTAYTPTERECDEDPLIAASMRKVRLGTVAVSRDLFESGWVFGKKIYITGYGIYEINDLMNSRFTKRVDIFMWERDKAMNFGRKKIKVALLEF
ncbi:MAG: 3D domain-containing protein [Desulfovibrionales bacterium]